MRWEALFDDLEAQAEALAVAERAAEVDERARIEFAAVTLGDRLRAAVGQRVRLQVRGGLTASGVLLRAGSDWLLLEEAGGREQVVVLSAVGSVSGASRFVMSADAVTARLGLRSVLRGIARDRSAVRVRLVDGAELDGTLDRVAADFVELARHMPGELRRAAAIRETVVVPITAIAAIRREIG